MLAPKLLTLTNTKGRERMEWDIEIKDSEYVPQNRKPTEETVCYKIGGIL